MRIWPLVGRRNELVQLTAAISNRRGAVITGPAGVGKTTLAGTVLEWARERGIAQARTTATRASQGLPFGAFTPMLPPQVIGEDRSREDLGVLLGRYSRAVVEEAGGKPLVVFVDDAHLLDPGSATLLHQLALHRAATVLATVRSGEAVPDAVRSLWKDGPAERIEIGPLDSAAMGELLASVLGGPVDTASVRELAERCQGNPLFFKEVVTGALDAGTLVSAEGIWRVRGRLQPTARLVELVTLRLSDLSRPERTVLELLALAEPLGQAEMTQLADPEAVDSVEEKALIMSRAEGRRVEVRLASPLYGDVIRAGTGPLHERALARSVAEVIESMGRRRQGDTLRVASLRLAGGGGNAKLLVAGASVARVHHDYSLALRLARAAIDEGAGFEARFLAAEAAHFHGWSDQAERELATLASEATDDAERARVALARFDNAYFLGRPDPRVVEDMVDTVSDPFWRDQLLTRRFFVSLDRGPRATVEAAARLLRAPQVGQLTPAHAAVSYSMVRVGHLDEAVRLFASLPDGEEIPRVDESLDQWALFGVRALALIYAGRLGEAEALLCPAYELIIAEPAAEARGLVAAQLAVLRLEQGRVQTAFRLAGESFLLFQQLGRPLLARWGYISAGLASALAGKPRHAADTLAAFDSIGLSAVLLDHADLLQARAWTAAAAGNLPAARAQLEAAADLGEEVGDLVGATSALHGLARLGRSREAAPRLTALAGRVDGALVAARADYANALAAMDSTRLRSVAGTFERLGALLYSAEASADAALILRRGGSLREAAAAEQRAARHLTRCQGAATPPLQRATARTRLTPAELEAAVLAGAGRSNRQIAAELQISVRTAESHLQRTYQKLGISGRRELPRALEDQPLDTAVRDGSGREAQGDVSSNTSSDY